MPKSQPDDSPISQRLIALIAHFEGGVQTRFAEKVGIATGIVGGMLGKKQSKPGLELTGKILQAYPSISERWLILGEGEMLKPEAPLKNNSVLSGPAIELHIEPEMSGNKRAPYINYLAAANYSGYQSQEALEQAETISLPPDLLPGKRPYFAFPVRGESMEPTFFTNDIVLCQEVPRQEWLNIKGEMLAVVVSRSNGLQLKRVTVNRQLKTLQCRSDNPISPPFILSIDDSEEQASDVLEVWSVEWRLTKHNDAPQREPAERFRTIEAEVGDLRYLIESIIDEREINRRLRERERNK
jgi:repressor LexA